VSAPRILIKCPICLCFADQLYSSKTKRWRCNFCFSTWAESDLETTVVILGDCPVHGAPDGEGCAFRAQSAGSSALEQTRFEAAVERVGR